MPQFNLIGLVMPKSDFSAVGPSDLLVTHISVGVAKAMVPEEHTI